MRTLRKSFYPLSLVGIDLLAYTLAFFCSVKARIWLGKIFPGIPDFSGDAMRMHELYFMPGLLLVIFFYEGLYRRRMPFIDELREITKSLAILTVFLFALISIGHLAHLVSRLTILMMAPLALLTIGIARYWGKVLLHRLGIGTQKLLIIGEVAAAARIKAELLAEKTLGYRFAGFVPIDRREENLWRKQPSTGLTRVGSADEVESILARREVECVLLATPSLSREKTSSLADKVYRYVHHVLMIPEMGSGALLNSELYHLFVNQMFLIKVRNSLTERPARFSKMLFDMVLVVVSLPVIAPVLVVIGLMVRATSPGPALFRQVRIGKNGKEIRVFKFRSMHRDAEAKLAELLARDPAARAEWKKTHKLRNDPRVTKLGAFLRRTSLDELPQLINVLCGDMSLVGPRPVTETELKTKYKGKADYYKLVRPGITGLWQISGRSDISYEQRVNMDSWYVFNWSLHIDLVILYRTIWVVLGRRGAY
ncbi:MAG: undecaprenyl-phosphate galactose phosphotransferase WbaP [Spirochaetota bacterium]